MSYTRTKGWYNKNGKVREGLTINNINTYTQTDDPAKKDRNNRMAALKKIIDHVESGKELDEAIEIVANDVEVRDNFKYLIDAGIDFKKLLRSWYESNMAKDKTFYLNER